MTIAIPNGGALRLAAVDLDETIVRSDRTISPRTLDLFHKWRETRGPVVIATGRPPRWTRRIPDDLHEFPWICYNGAVAYENGQEIYRHDIALETVRDLVALFQQEAPGGRLGLEIDDILYINQDLGRPDAQVVDDLLSVADRPAAKILVALEDFQRISGEHVERFQEVQPLVSEKVSLVQIMALGASKGRALSALVARWRLSMANVVAFGDDVNDVEMVRDSGFGVAMSNAVPVKAVANRITGSNDEDGVATVLAELLGCDD
ncbi:MAG: HAD family hydrolase [Caldilineaceae bacterium]